MRKQPFFIRLNIGNDPHRPDPTKWLSSLFGLVVSIAVFILLLPVLGAVFVIALALMAGAALGLGGWWLIKGRKAVQKMQEDIQAAMQNPYGAPPGANPRKKVKVHVHDVAESAPKNTTVKPEEE